MPNCIISSSAATRRLGAACARQILKTRPGRRAAVVALVGDLGSGKTTFAQGFMRGLGIRRQVTSPTFILMRRMALTRKKFKNVFHIDLYRIHRASELPKTYVQEIIQAPENIVIIEWADKVRRLLPRGTRWIQFEHGAREHERILECKMKISK